MFLLLRFFNSVVFVIVNLSIAVYALQKFFRTMKCHYHLVNEVEKFSSLVNASRASLDYVGTKVVEAMKEMESDIGKEVYVTHNLTKLSTKIASVSKRFHDLEEEIIELARLNHNMENATVETPSDINEEVRKILRALKRSKSPSMGDQNQHQHRPHSKSSKLSRSHHGIIESNQQPPSSPKVRPTSRSRSPDIVVPEVELLQENRYCPTEKPIGFRPPWMCEV